MIRTFVCTIWVVSPSSIIGLNSLSPVARSPADRAERTALRLAEIPSPEFSRILDVHFPSKHVKESVCASSAECLALAKRFELESLASLQANMTLALVDRRRNRMRVKGKLSATDVRRLNLGGELITLQVTEAPFECHFISPEYVSAATIGLEVDDEEAYDEPIEDGQIDLGELVAQFFYIQLQALAEQEMSEWSVGDDFTVVYDSAEDENFEP
mmetsp:Transcript_11958/g.20191  ORF Transcript_11958/g.20191 Transcript_11958/m.20191 type:complete len:214 (-) Transcript_11958:323-964(-)